MSATMPRPEHVIDATTKGFSTEVIEKSHEVPVVIDFWAEWCGPCRMLGPVLEKLASEYAGSFLLAKVDTEKEQELALQFGVRSIPAVFAVRDGKIVDGFVGVQPETTIRAWIDRLLPTAAEALAAEGRRLEKSDPRAAEDKYTAALAADPELAVARIGLARIALEEGRLDDAAVRVAELERRGFLETEAEKVKAELTLRAQAGNLGSVEAARAALASSQCWRNLGDFRKGCHRVSHQKGVARTPKDVGTFSVPRIWAHARDFQGIRVQPLRLTSRRKPLCARQESNVR